MAPEVAGGQARRHGVAWGATATPRQQVASFLLPLGIFVQFVIVAISLQLRRNLLKYRLSSTLVFVTY